MPLSANPYFLGGTDLHDTVLARADERESLGTYAALIEEVRARCGADVAALFAEPIRGTNRTTGEPNVAWYCSTEGAAFPLRQVEGAARGQVIELLRNRLRSFTSLFSDSRQGAVFASWLHILSPDSIVAVAGQPVIRNWAMLPKGVAGSVEARETHFRNGIGHYMPTIPIPPFGAVEAQDFAAAMGRHGEREAARATGPAIGVTAVAVAPSPYTVRPWLAPAIAASLAALVFGVLAFGQVLRYPYLATGPTKAEIQAQRQTNEALRERLARLKGAVVEACRAGDAVPGAPPSLGLLPPSPERTKVESTDPATRQPETGTLGTLLERATVLVMMEHSLGSGFFVSDRYIVTNHHVVGDAREAKVASRVLGGLVPARVVAVGAGAERGTEDIAVLEIAPKAGTSALSVGVAPGRLDPVTASGFPGAVLETIQAKRSAGLPEANFTQGIVTSHQVQQPGAIATIIHTAQIGHGNSGGPLVDAGGCAVGINSWLSPDAMGDVVFSTYFQALDASELRRFLKAHDIAFIAVDASCKPVAPAAAPASAPTPAEAP